MQNESREIRIEKNNNNIDCGQIDGLCPSCIIIETDPGEPVPPDITIFTELGGTNDEYRGVDDNFLQIKIGNENFIVYPAQFYDSKSTEFYIKTRTDDYVSTNVDNEYVKSNFQRVKIP